MHNPDQAQTAGNSARRQAMEVDVRCALGSERYEELLAQSQCLRQIPKRLLFTVTSGRSGTGALSTCMGAFRGLVAKHEPRPSFADALRAVNQSKGLALEFWVRRKLPAIAKTSAPAYLETSHLAGLGFLEELELLGLPIELVLLTRPARLVALSLWRLDTIPGRSLRGHRYYLSPRDSTNLRLPTRELGKLHDYQLCYWYAREVEARQSLWKQRAMHGGPRVIPLSVEELEGTNAIDLLRHRFGLEPRSKAGRFLRQGFGSVSKNEKTAKKRQRNLPTEELERLELEVSLLWGTPRIPQA